MAGNRTLFVALAIACVAALAGLVWMMMVAGIPLRHVPSFLINLGPVLKTCVMLSVASTAIGVVSLFVGARPRLVIGVGGAVGWGFLGALYGAASARSGLICMNPPIPFSIYAPGYAEALIVLLVGLTGAILCLGLLHLRSRRQVGPPKTAAPS